LVAPRYTGIAADIPLEHPMLAAWVESAEDHEALLVFCLVADEEQQVSVLCADLVEEAFPEGSHGCAVVAVA
jgi:hypothetical protein